MLKCLKFVAKTQFLEILSDFSLNLVVANKEISENQL